MKALRIADYDAVPLLEEISIPPIGADEILVRVLAAALNPLDLHIQSGAVKAYFPVTFPFTLGTDFTGTVERVGDDVTRWRPGDMVIARPDPKNGGGFAEFAVVPADRCAALPISLSATDAAGIPTAASTAHQALFETAGLQSGQTILIHAGAGGVGSFAVQFARAAGARVFATASGEGVAIVQQLGADTVIDYHSQDFGDVVAGVDVVLDTIGGDTQVKSFDVLKRGGQLVSTVMPPDKALALARDVSAYMIHLGLDGNRLQAVVDTVADQTIQVLIDRTLPFSSFAQAFERQGSGRARGKIILTIG